MFRTLMGVFCVILILTEGARGEEPVTAEEAISEFSRWADHTKARTEQEQEDLNNTLGFMGTWCVVVNKYQGNIEILKGDPGLNDALIHIVKITNMLEVFLQDKRMAKFMGTCAEATKPLLVKK